MAAGAWHSGDEVSKASSVTEQLVALRKMLLVQASLPDELVTGLCLISSQSANSTVDMVPPDTDLEGDGLAGSKQDARKGATDLLEILNSKERLHALARIVESSEHNDLRDLLKDQVSKQRPSAALDGFAATQVMTGQHSLQSQHSEGGFELASLPGVSQDGGSFSFDVINDDQVPSPELTFVPGEF
jgi:hypothetical protein